MGLTTFCGILTTFNLDIVMLSTTEGGRNCWNESRVDDSWELNELQPYDESSTEKLSYQCMMFFKKMR